MMAVEIERKFLVKDDSWKSSASPGVACIQGYLVSSRRKTIRVRIMGEKGYLTIKEAIKGISRMEFEYEIPVVEAKSILKMARYVIEKTRYWINYGDMVWELDIFKAANAGLIMAEIELQSEEQKFDIPSWAGEEVSEDLRYRNASLAKHPFSTFSVSRIIFS